MQQCDNSEYCTAFDQLKLLHEHLGASAHPPALLERFHALVTEFYQMVKMSPDQALMMRLSSTHATSNSLHAFQWRIESRMASLGEEVEGTTGSGWQQQRRDSTKLFASGLSDTFLVLQKLKTTEERAAYLKTLKAEMETPLEKHTPEELNTMKKTYEGIATKLEMEEWSELIPEWFIPWYELIVDEWTCLGEGGFGSVNRAKWLDSEVVVKRVTLPGSSGRADASTTSWSLSASEDPYATEADADPLQRSKAIAMFRCEVDIWFGFSHPHVIRLVGACHVGRPFFVCEYATNGTLVSYLRVHPEAALGVQYLHARDVVHGDLKGNNIVIGSDFKAKVTDFGLSSAASSEDTAQISGALHWVAPECFPANKSEQAQQQANPTFASDVYSLGMCIVEALRVVEAMKAGKDPRGCLPWRVADRNVVRYHATHGTLPARPMCSDSQWDLVVRMCKLEAQKRLKISTVVDELARLANLGTATEVIAVPNQDSVSEMITAGQEEVAQVQGATDHHDQMLSLSGSLWKRLERVHEQIANSARDDCHASFYSLVADTSACTCTKKLQHREGGIVTLAETTMRYYVRDRALTSPFP